MAHPSDYLGKGGMIIIDENQGAVSAPSGKVFVAIQNTGALATNGSTSTFTVKGSGLYEYVDIDGASAANVVKYINPATGEAYVDEDAADSVTAGYFEVVADAKTVTIEVAPGQIVYGRFTEVDATDSNAAILYLARS
tara:strand:+ start:40 stop:453 length:414 start_codon:yes stop_codon:yes gene_type:complete